MKIAIWYSDEFFMNNIYDSIVKNQEKYICSLSESKISFKNGDTITFMGVNREPRGKNFSLAFVQDVDIESRSTVFSILAEDGEIYKIKSYKDFKRIIENLNKEQYLS